jgi:hypothetical protein
LHVRIKPGSGGALARYRSSKIKWDMKNLIFILIAILLLNCKKDGSDNGNKIDSIVDNSKVWYLSEHPNHCQSCAWPHKIMFGKDTTINSYSYKTILDYRGDSIEGNSKASILGYLRETSDKKVYWYVAIFGQVESDLLIYDFNANINDTIDNWIVTNIDTVNILNINRKRLALRNCEASRKYWIDGIGNMADLLSYPSRTICDYKTGIVMMNIGGSGFKQNCVKQGNEFIYKDSLTTDCWSYRGDARLNKH